MQTQIRNDLPRESLAAIVRSLEVRTLQSGPKILGSQLGVLVNQAMFPLNCRDFGGLKEFVDGHLGQYVKGIGISAEANDHSYQILIEPQASKRPAQVPAQAQEVVGDNLWRFFSNPNLACSMATLAPSSILVAPTADLLPPESVELRRMQAADYKEWAREFASTHEISEEFEQAAATADFYKAWIPMLRKANAGPINYLKSWESLRSEKVAQQLTVELTRAGIEPSRVAEIVGLARPIGRVVRANTPVHVPVLSEQLSALRRHSVFEAGEPTVINELSQLRQLLHRALDVMTMEELREIRVSAGTWMKIGNKSSV